MSACFQEQFKHRDPRIWYFMTGVQQIAAYFWETAQVLQKAPHLEVEVNHQKNPVHHSSDCPTLRPSSYHFVEEELRGLRINAFRIPSAITSHFLGQVVWLHSIRKGRRNSHKDCSVAIKTVRPGRYAMVLRRH